MAANPPELPGSAMRRAMEEARWKARAESALPPPLPAPHAGRAPAGNAAATAHADLCHHPGIRRRGCGETPLAPRGGVVGRGRDGTFQEPHRVRENHGGEPLSRPPQVARPRRRRRVFRIHRLRTQPIRSSHRLAGLCPQPQARRPPLSPGNGHGRASVSRCLRVRWPTTAANAR